MPAGPALAHAPLHQQREQRTVHQVSIKPRLAAPPLGKEPDVRGRTAEIIIYAP
jgi:hypothetical protein